MIQISDEVRRAWAMVQGAPPDWLIDTLANFARDQLAARLEAEYLNDHYMCALDACGFGGAHDKHHWASDDWQREAERLLSGEKR